MPLHTQILLLTPSFLPPPVQFMLRRVVRDASYREEHFQLLPTQALPQRKKKEGEVEEGEEPGGSASLLRAQQGINGVGGATAAKQHALRQFGPDALAVAVHDAIISCGIMHRQMHYLQIAVMSNWLAWKSMYTSQKQHHYSALNGSLWLPLHATNDGSSGRRRASLPKTLVPVLREYRGASGVEAMRVYDVPRA